VFPGALPRRVRCLRTGAGQAATAGRAPGASRRAAYGARQCRHVAPAPRQVAAELEHAWALALPALKQAEAAERQRAQAGTPPATALSPPLPAAFRAMGHKLPALWPTDVLSQAQRKAWLRGLLAKGVSPRARRDQLPPRMVWRGGATPTWAVPGAVGARTDRPRAHEMAPQSRGLCAAGTSADAMARPLPPPGSRSPSRPTVLPSTGKGSRLTLGRMPSRSPSHPRRVAGALTVPQLAKAWEITPHGGYHQSTRGPVASARDTATGAPAFPTLRRRGRRFGSDGRASAARAVTARRSAARPRRARRVEDCARVPPRRAGLLVTPESGREPPGMTGRLPTLCLGRGVVVAGGKWTMWQRKNQQSACGACLPPGAEMLAQPYRTGSLECAFAACPTVHSPHSATKEAQERVCVETPAHL
jgi:hypothetical protein